MKKKIVALLMCIALLATAVVFAACGPTSLVDTSGNYQASTKEEVTKLLEGKTIGEASAYEVKLDMSVEMTVEELKVSSKINYGAVMTVGEDNKYTMSGDMSASGTGADGKEQTIKTSFYMDTEALYMTIEGQKVKMPVGASGAYVPTDPIPKGDLSEMLSSMPADATIEVATSGDITKVKLAYSVEGEGSSTMYVILDKGEFAGLVLTGGAEEMGMTMTLEIAPTTKTVTVPTDLDSYTPMA